MSAIKTKRLQVTRHVQDLPKTKKIAKLQHPQPPIHHHLLTTVPSLPALPVALAIAKAKELPPKPRPFMAVLGESGATWVDACHPGSSIERGFAALEWNESTAAQQALRTWTSESRWPRGQVLATVGQPGGLALPGLHGLRHSCRVSRGKQILGMITSCRGVILIISSNLLALH